MTRRETNKNGLQLNEDVILWSLCGRNQIKGIRANIKQNARTETNSDTCKQINQSGESDSRQESRYNPSLAYKTFPPEVQPCWSSIPGYKLGVMATSLIPQGVWIGPYLGKLVKPEELKSHVERFGGNNLWEIFHENQLICYVDGSDVNTSSWMRFIQCARSHVEQNMNAFQYQGNIYYRAMREIHDGEELLVWYDDDSYPQYMGIPLLSHPPSSSHDIKTYLGNKITTKRKLLDNVQNCPAKKRPESQVLNEEDVSAESLRNMRENTNSSVNENKKPESKSGNSTLEPEEVLERTQKQEEDKPSASSEPRSLDRCDSVDNQCTLKCGQCSTNFSQRYTLQIHVCPKQTDSPYQCGYCNMSFTNPSYLRSHVVKHVSEKPFKCGFCARSFVGSTTLNNHIRMHTGKTPFHCLKCGVTFSQGAQFARHSRIGCNGNAFTNRCES